MGTLVIETLVAFTFFGAGASEDNDNDAIALKGKWEIVAAQFEGEPATKTFRPGTTIVIEDGKLYFTDGFTRSENAKYKINSAKAPKWIDIDGGGENGVIKGIYSREKDTLKLCLNLMGMRPTEFKTTAGDKTNLLTLRRQNP
jgi:uncharacterized protein (TIGR03067 family)